MNKENVSSVLGVCLGILAISGWILNLIAFIGLDFKSPYKAEAFRTIGIASPAGAILGYINIKD